MEKFYEIVNVVVLYLKDGQKSGTNEIEYLGKVYKAPSGQWSWVIYEDGEEYYRGAGYPSEAAAKEELKYQLAELNRSI